MTREKITTCHVAGCGRNTTLYRRHCITVHDMTDYIYKFFLALSQSWDKEFTYNYNDDFICFNDDTNDNLLLKLCHPTSVVLAHRLFPNVLLYVSGEISPPPAPSRSLLPSTRSSLPSTSPIPTVSLTPKPIRYPPSSVAGRLQQAGMYNLASEFLPKIQGFLHSLHMAQGVSRTAKTIQLYNNARKLYHYLKENNPLEPFSEDNVSAAFETLIRCGLARDFVFYLSDRGLQPQTVKNIVLDVCSKYNKCKNLSQRMRTVKCHQHFK